jgi:hypothetical protein
MALQRSVKVMEKLSPYTVMLTTNLEPIWNCITLYFIIGGKENEHLFYIGCNYHHYGDIKWNH